MFLSVYVCMLPTYLQELRMDLDEIWCLATGLSQERTDRTSGCDQNLELDTCFKLNFKPGSNLKT